MMNKEQINKHRDVIIWFATGDNADKGVWSKGINGWFMVNEPDWCSEVYIQNDEYSELRKAQADGKVIQIMYYNEACENGENWEQFTGIDTSKGIDRHRIKPDEPKFKVGDWVTRNLSPSKPIQLKAEWQRIYGEDAIELWRPQEGEWCVFWNCSTAYYIERYGQHNKNELNIAPLEFVQTLKDK